MAQLVGIRGVFRTIPHHRELRTAAPRAIATANVTAGRAVEVSSPAAQPSHAATVGGCHLRSWLQCFAQRGQALLADAVHLCQLVDRAEAAVGVAVLDDSRPPGSGRCRRPRRAVRGWRVERWTCAEPARPRPRHAAPARAAPHRHDDLLPVLDLRGEIHQGEIGSRESAPLRASRALATRVSGRNPDQAGPAAPPRQRARRARASALARCATGRGAGSILTGAGASAPPPPNSRVRGEHRQRRRHQPDHHRRARSALHHAERTKKRVTPGATSVTRA